MAPDPTTIIVSGSLGSTSACFEEITCSPSMGMNGISRGRAPVARMMWSASYSVPSTSIRPFPFSFAKPLISSTLFF